MALRESTPLFAELGLFDLIDLTDLMEADFCVVRDLS